MACVHSACFTILFQGTGGGFISPTRGIRQGCALSPYIFILCMNILTSMLEYEQRQRRLTGLALNRIAPPITNLIYADDLLLMGKADRREVRLIQRTLQLFCEISGQRMASEKSKLWISKATTLAQVRFIIRTFGAKFAGENETYLGGPVNVSRPSAFKSLIQKIDSKLHAWKARLLSPAGKVVVLKSVIEYLAIYLMSTTLITSLFLIKFNLDVCNFFGEREVKSQYAMLNRIG